MQILKKLFRHKKHDNTCKNYDYEIMRYCAPEKLDLLLSDMFYKLTGKLATETLTTFNEKLLWLSMFERTPLKEQCADKVRVREYVSKTIGNKYLPTLYDVLERGQDFNPEKYPNQFVISYNAGSGENLIVNEKSKLDIIETRKIINKWMFHNVAYFRGEMQYYNIKPRVIVREMLDIKSDIEYKLFCFNGQVEFIQVISYVNGHTDIGVCHYDRNWNKLPFYRSDPGLHNITDEIIKPKNLHLLISLAEKLSKPFKFARIDFYELTNNDIKFGEITFTPTAAQIIFSPDNDKWQKYFAEKIDITDANLSY